jgi:hypothetical protein
VNGNFGLARAIGDRSFAVAGLGGAVQVARAFGYETSAVAFSGTGQFARAFGYQSEAWATDGTLNVARAGTFPYLLGGLVGARAYAENGNANFARAVGDGTIAKAGQGDLNLAWTGLFTRLNAANEAYAQFGNGNVAAIWGNGNIARAGGTFGTGNDRNLAIVAGQVSTANAGPGSTNRVVVVGFNKSQSKPAAGASARSARQR